MKIDNGTVLAILEKQFPSFLFANSEPHGMLTVETFRENLPNVLRFLKEHKELDFNFLTSLCAVHYPDVVGKEICMVYHLHSFRNNIRIRVKAYLPIGDPRIESATSLWPAANWMERQEYDFFGVQFTGHPDLRRILNVDDMTVFPMRKDYRLEDGTRTDKDDRFFGRDGHVGQYFD
jgi:NADH-quinone oxidoreductase subunit C